MEPGSKNWATEYLLDPLNEPQPSQETGPGSHFRPESAASSTTTTSPKLYQTSPPQRKLSKNPYRKSFGTVTESEIKRSSSMKENGAYPSPPPSASPTQMRSPAAYREDVFGDHNVPGRRRGSSLGQRFPGDMSHRPLDTLTKQKHVADRSRHSTKKHHIQPDTIDGLDTINGGPYHHEGPYDATLFARNNSFNSPLAAVSASNAETLKATPHEKIVDSVQGHRPLDGVATYAPGEADRNGTVYQYEQGENMMVDNGPEGGAYKRWPGVQYHPDDIKGKGEPSYTIEKALKEHTLTEKGHGRHMSGDGIEMESRSRSGSGALPRDSWDDGEANMRRSGSFSKRLSSGSIRKRFGSIRKHLKNED